MISAPVSTGNATSTMKLVRNRFHVRIGMRNIVIPGARSIVMVVMMLTAPSVPDVPVRMIGDDPQVGAEARASRPVPTAAGRRTSRTPAAPPSVTNPSSMMTPPNRYSQYDERVEAGEGQVGRADLQRHEVVGEGEPERDGEQVHHHAAVDREDAVVRRLVDELQARLGQLGADDAGQRAADGEEHERRHGVGDADRLVVGRRQPARRASAAARCGARPATGGARKSSTETSAQVGVGGRRSSLIAAPSRPVARSHCSNSAGVTTRTENRILWWSSPQNSAHTPRVRERPGARADVDLERRVSPGNMSRLKRKPGIQNEWMTSIDVRSKRTDGVGRQHQLGRSRRRCR